MKHRLYFLGQMEVQMITPLDQMSLGREWTSTQMSTACLLSYSPQVSYKHKER
jgi:hypothetical protein